MASLIYRCPFTGRNVQEWTGEEIPSGDVYVSVVCPACARTHLVNPATGRVLGVPDQPGE
jgi:hypothetical protein